MLAKFGRTTPELLSGPHLTLVPPHVHALEVKALREAVHLQIVHRRFGIDAVCLLSKTCR